MTRRQLLWLSAMGPHILGRQMAAAPPPLFEEIPTSRSGIEWVHDNAMSVEHYLPETLGPGCAFLDFDNDGWMDIYLVNSGP
ncbi:MAG: VCBS repeat-containing protein, partial [Acidobacteriaceae bacterium]|nr:VCBS repeat-containing protein [Acidobacteriaceae bacterium]